MTDKADIYRSAFDTMQSAEDEICERTLSRLQEHATVMGLTVEQALNDVVPETRKRLTDYMARKAAPVATGFRPMRRLETHCPEGGTTGVNLTGEHKG